MPEIAAAHACSREAVTFTKLPGDVAATGTGTELLMNVPLPSSPLELSPQHHAVPSGFTAHVLAWAPDTVNGIAGVLVAVAMVVAVTVGVTVGVRVAVTVTVGVTVGVRVTVAACVGVAVGDACVTVNLAVALR